MKLASIALLLCCPLLAQNETPKPNNLSLARVTCKTCALEVKKPKHFAIVRTLEFAAPVAAALAIGRAVAPNSPPVKLTPVVGSRVVSFCIVGQTC
jgi:hypothetical protein